MTSICEVRADCMTVPLSVELMARSLTSTSSVVTTSGPIGMLPSKFLPAVHWLAARCQSRHGRVVEHHEARDGVQRLVGA